jgi:biopolymer transport protein ExbB/TolQ
MDVSDIIAIVAIIASAIVSIIAAITSYRNTKLSIQARRSEMAFEKQIEAFRELAEKLGGIRKSFAMFSIPVSEREQETFFARVEKAILDYHFTYQKFRLYLPSDLDSALREFTQKAVIYYSDADYSKHKEFLDEFNKIEPKIIKIMNKYMGIN